MTILKKGVNKHSCQLLLSTKRFQGINAINSAKKILISLFGIVEIIQLNRDLTFTN